MSDQVAALLAAVAGDPGLAARLAAAEDWDQVADLAQGLGYAVTVAELAQTLGSPGVQLSDEELAGAAGGTSGAAFCTTLGCGVATVWFLGCRK